MRGEKAHGKVGAIVQNVSPKGHLEGDGSNYERCGDKELCLVEVKSSKVGFEGKIHPVTSYKIGKSGS